MCDAIWEAANGSTQTPDVLIDAATLTGGAWLEGWGWVEG